MIISHKNQLDYNVIVSNLSGNINLLPLQGSQEFGYGAKVQGVSGFFNENDTVINWELINSKTNAPVENFDNVKAVTVSIVDQFNSPIKEISIDSAKNSFRLNDIPLRDLSQNIYGDYNRLRNFRVKVSAVDLNGARSDAFFILRSITPVITGVNLTIDQNINFEVLGENVENFCVCLDLFDDSL